MRSSGAARGIRFAYLIEPPFCFRAEDGGVSGCDVEVAHHLASRTGMGPVTLIETDFAELLPGLADGRWDMTTGLFATQERRRRALFSRPIWALPDGLLIRTEMAGAVGGYRSIAAHSSLRLAVVAHQVQHETARSQGIPEERISIFGGYPQAADAVRRGKADAFASVARAHGGYLERNPDPGLSLVDVPAAEKPAAFGAFSVARDNPGLLNAMDGELERYLGSPAHRSLMAGFGFSDSEINLIC